MESSWTLPISTASSGKRVPIEKMKELYKAGVNPEDVFNIVLGSKDYIVSLDKYLFTPITDTDIFPPRMPTESKLTKIRSDFKEIILNMYDLVKDDWVNTLVSGVWPKEEKNIKNRKKKKKAFNLTDTNTETIKEVYGMVRNIALLLYSGDTTVPAKKWKLIVKKVDRLIKYLENVIIDPNPNDAMSNIVDRMSLMSYSTQVGNYSELLGSEDRSSLNKLLEPSKVHPSIQLGFDMSEYGHITNTTRYQNSLSGGIMENPSELLTEGGDVQVEEDSVISILRETEKVEDDFKIGFVSGKD